MKLSIKTTNLELTPEIKKAIEEKFAVLDKYTSHIKTPVKAFVEVALETRHHKKGKIFYAEANIQVPGRMIRAEAEEEGIFQAINEIKDELRRLLEEYKKIEIDKRKAA